MFFTSNQGLKKGSKSIANNWNRFIAGNNSKKLKGLFKDATIIIMVLITVSCFKILSWARLIQN